MTTHTHLATAGVALVLLFVSGCTHAHMFWTADGSRAAYVSGGDHPEAAVIDANGGVIAALGPCGGGLAWAIDSETLYFASIREHNEATTRPLPIVDIRRNWLEDDVKNDPPAPRPDGDTRASAVITMWRDGHSTELFSITPAAVVYATVSPDQKWLLVVNYVYNRQPFESRYELYAYALFSKHLYLLCDNCSLGICFTSLNRLAYISGGSAAHPRQPALLTEAVLNEANHADEAPLPRRALAEVLLHDTMWVQSLGDDLLLATLPQSLPQAPVPEAEPSLRLYRLSRASGRLTAVADNVGMLFLPSPDGQRILFEKVTHKTATSEAIHELTVMNNDGTNLHVLAKVDANEDAFIPTWRTKDEIVYTSPLANPPEHPDVALYRLTPEGQLQPLRTLSRDWPVDVKPTHKKN